MLYIQVRVFKQPHPEDVFQQTHRRLFHPCPHPGFTVFFAAYGVGFDDGFGFVVAPELVYPGHQHFVMPFGNAEFVYAPGFACREVVQYRFVAGDAPVGAGHPVILVFGTHQIGDDVFVVAVADVFFVFDVLVPGDGVIWHHRRGHHSFAFQLKSPIDERDKMGLELFARIHRKLAHAIMRVASGFTGATTRPVFHHGVYAAITPAIGNFLSAG